MPETVTELDELVQPVLRPDGQGVVRHTITITPNMQLHVDYSRAGARALARQLGQAADEAQLLG